MAQDYYTLMINMLFIQERFLALLRGLFIAL